MRITRIHIKIKNHSDHKLIAGLLHAAQNKNVPGNNLYDCLKVSVKLNTTEMNFVPATYQNLLDYLYSTPFRLKVIHTTNNRQLSFLTRIDGDLLPTPIYPKKNKNGEPFTTDEMMKLSEWNIADSGDIFNCGLHEEIVLDILPKQEFNIFLSVKPQPKSEPAPVLVADKKTTPLKTYLHHFQSPNDSIDKAQKKPCLCKKSLTYSKFTDCDGNCTY